MSSQITCQCKALSDGFHDCGREGTASAFRCQHVHVVLSHIAWCCDPSSEECVRRVGVPSGVTQVVAGHSATRSVSPHESGVRRGARDWHLWSVGRPNEPEEREARPSVRLGSMTRVAGGSTTATSSNYLLETVVQRKAPKVDLRNHLKFTQSHQGCAWCGSPGSSACCDSSQSSGSW